MNTKDKNIFLFRPLRIACAIGIALVPAAGRAQVSEADFNALKEAVRKLTEKVERMEQIHTNDEQIHLKDQEQIK